MWNLLYFSGHLKIENPIKPYPHLNLFILYVESYAKILILYSTYVKIVILQGTYVKIYTHNRVCSRWLD